MNSKKHARVEGQSLVLIALLMVAMIAFLGLVIDGGAVMLNRRSSQNASDAAAFAGVRVLALRANNSVATENSIWDTMTSIAAANDIVTATDVIASFIDQNGNDICHIHQNCNGVPTAPYPTGVRVTTTLHLQPYFINIVVGNASIPVRAIAAVQSGPGTVSPVMPMTLPFPCTYDPLHPNNCPLVYGQAYTLTGQSQLPGGFQWIDYSGGSSVPDLVNYLTQYWTSGPVLADPGDVCVPYPGTAPVCAPPNPSSWIPSSSGLSPDDKVRAALDAWIDPSKWGTGPGAMNWGPPPTTDKWIVPVFDRNCCTGSNAKYHVIFFAEFKLLGYWFANNQCNWYGAPAHHNCTTDFPAEPTTGWQLSSCNTANQQCILGTFEQDVPNLELLPGQCNTNGLNVCGFGLSQ